MLPDDWPEDMHPLRKDAMDYRLRPEPTTDSETYAFINEGNSDARVIPVGPLHITSYEPGHFRLFVDGEQIVDADYRLFYVHRGMEKLAETRMGYNEVTFLSDRVCGIAVLPTVWPIPTRLKMHWGLRCRNEHILFARFCWKSSGYTVICSTLASPAILLVLIPALCNFSACGKSR